MVTLVPAPSGYELVNCKREPNRESVLQLHVYATVQATRGVGPSNDLRTTCGIEQ
jgi:hypothetical protein